MPERPLHPARGLFLPGLDGLRGLSIGLVILSHIQGTRGFPKLPGWFWHFGDLGNLGVRVFFVLSGFLISLLLLREEDRLGAISLWGFWARRAMRILPALLAFLIIALGARWLGLIWFPMQQWSQSLLFIGDVTFTPTSTWSLGHLWSLAVEQQFYLIWPAFLVLAPTQWRVPALLGSMVCAPLYRLAYPAGVEGEIGWISWAFPRYVDALATGCLLAFLHYRDSQWLKAVNRTGVLTASFPFLVLIINGLALRPWLIQLAVWPALHLLIATIVRMAVINKMGPWQALLEWRPVVLAGWVSYSLYLWQQIFLDRSSDQSFASFPLNLLLAVSLATMSFLIVERPALKWYRDRPTA